MGTLPPRILDRLVRDDAGCLLWTGATTNGYGRVYFAGRARLVHRLVYEAERGPVAPGLDLDHLCRVRACAEPSHLEPVDRRTNVVRGGGRPAGARTNTCPRGHVYDDHRENGYHRCRPCAADNARRRYALRRASVDSPSV